MGYFDKIIKKQLSQLTLLLYYYYYYCYCYIYNNTSKSEKYSSSLFSLMAQLTLVSLTAN